MTKEQRTKTNRGRGASGLKTIWSLLAVCVLLLTMPLQAFAVPVEGDTGQEPAVSIVPSDELRGVWISYLDWEEMPADRAGFQKAVDEILQRCVDLKMNAVFVHVRPDAAAGR